MSERRIYLVLAVLTALTFIAILPLLEAVLGIVLLLVTVTYSFVAMHTGLPPLLKCGDYCSR
jgi:hypothetical protein